MKNRVAWALVLGLVGSRQLGGHLLLTAALQREEPQPTTKQQSLVTLDVSLPKSSAERLVLALRLRYEGERPLQVSKSLLPWKNTYSLLLVAVPADAAGTPLKKSYPIDDPGPSRVTIRPGQVLTGKIDLTRRFPDLARIL
jgi:hypothetical protein